jgi:protoporphyrinogen oxidase
MSAANHRWAVVGGGILGMTLAHRLRQAGQEVALYEAAPDLGGLASAWSLPVPGHEPITWDRHYHVTLLSDARVRSLLGELGLEDDMQWVETRTGCFSAGELYSVSNTVEFLRFPPLGLLDKLRLGGTIFYGSKIRDGRRMEQIDVSRWLRRWSGTRTYDRFWLPLLRAKLGESYREASAGFIWATIQRLYAARRSGLKKEMFGYVPGGYARTIDTFAARLAQDGVSVRTATPVSAITRSGEGFTLSLPDGDEVVDRVIVTTASTLASRLCADLDGEERRRLDEVRYQGIVCASVVLRHPMAPYYLTYLTDDDAPFTAIVEMTSFVDPSEMGGNTLVYLPKYVAPDDPLFDATDDEVRAAFLPYLQKVHPALSDRDVLAFQVSRARQVFAVPTIDYSQHVPPIVTSVPGLYLAGSAHLVNATLNVDDTLSLVDDALAAIDAAEAGRRDALVATP